VKTAACEPAVVISQVYGGGGDAGATYQNDFVELFNRGTTTVSLAGWYLRYGSATGTGAWSSGTALSGSIAPGHYYLIREGSGGSNGAPLPTADATGSISMSAGQGKVMLLKSSAVPSGACPTPTDLVDLVGYGSANCREGVPTAALSSSKAAVRASDGCVDTGDNSKDLVAATPTPRNSSSPAVTTCLCN